VKDKPRANPCPLGVKLTKEEIDMLLSMMPDATPKGVLGMMPDREKWNCPSMYKITSSEFDLEKISPGTRLNGIIDEYAGYIDTL
jgi:hypothetical protein